MPLLTLVCGHSASKLEMVIMHFQQQAPSCWQPGRDSLQRVQLDLKDPKAFSFKKGLKHAFSRGNHKKHAFSRDNHKIKMMLSKGAG